MLNNSNIYVKQTAEHVTKLLKDNLDQGFHFHNLKHTKHVVMAVAELGRQESLSTEEVGIVSIAAWFHDTGLCTKYNGHEEVSKELAERFLSEIGYNNNRLQQVVNCIDATKMPQVPKNSLQKVICDADLHHLSSNTSMEWQNLLRKEWEVKLQKFYSDEEWCSENISFMKTHHYFTKYGIGILENRKQKNIRSIERALEKSC